MKLFRGLVVGLVCSVAFACNAEDSLAPDFKPVRRAASAVTASVRITPASLALDSGATGGLRCDVLDANGNVIQGRKCSWTSQNTAVATVNTGSLTQNVVVSALKPGTAGIRAGNNGVADTALVTVTAVQSPPPDTTSCLRNVPVATASQLLAAADAAQPGDCINLAPGTYSLGANYNESRGGTSAHPVVFRGAGPASTIIQGTGSNAWQFVTGANYIQFKNLRFTNFFYGPVANPYPFTTTGGNYLVFDSVEVDHNQQQGIAASNGAVGGIVRNSYIHHMGLARNGTCGTNTGPGGQFGEGVYIGGHGANTTDWQVLNTRFDNITAEAVDISPGAHRTRVEGNTIDGSASVFYPNCTTSLIASYGDDVVIKNNTLSYGNPHGIALYGGSRVIISGNHIALFNLHNYFGAFGVHTGGWGATVSCDNVVTDIPPGGAAFDVGCTN